MTDIEKKKSRNEIPWHPAFVVALKATLIDYDDALDYRLEHPLASEPLRIDILVIKKRPEVVVKKQIAEIFRLENIVEYKNPKKSLSVNEFHKAFARAHLYKALADVKITDMTLSFAVTAYPRELFKHLRNTLGYAVDERHPGVYVVTGATMPIQILISGKLSKEENLFLRNLNSNLPDKDLNWLSRLEKKYGSRLDMSVYEYAVLTANQDKLSKEDIAMLTARTRKIIEESDIWAKWRQEYIEEGIEKGKLEDARAMFAEGFKMDVISRVTKIPLKMLKKKLSAQ
jgi:hypothetical protein